MSLFLSCFVKYHQASSSTRVTGFLHKLWTFLHGFWSIHRSSFFWSSKMINIYILLAYGFYCWDTDTGLCLPLLGAGRNTMRSFTDSFYKKAEISHVRAARHLTDIAGNGQAQLYQWHYHWSLFLFMLFISLSYVTASLNFSILQQQPQFFIIPLD